MRTRRLCFFFREVFRYALVEIGSGDYLEEGLRYRLRRLHVYLAREADYSAEGRHWVAGERFFEGFERRRAVGRAAGRGVLDYGAGADVLEYGAAAEQGVEVEQVVE